MGFQESINKGASYLLNLQYEDGRFEGEFSASTFPTCAYALTQLEMQGQVDEKLVDWFEEYQNEEGYWGLDVSGGSDNEATLFAQLALMEILNTGHEEKIEEILSKVPDLDLKLWIIKIMYARCGRYDWKDLQAPWHISTAMRIGEAIMPILPKSMLANFKPPEEYAPPVRLFGSKAFNEMFIAEQYTLVPLLLIIETHTQKRDHAIKTLGDWLLRNQCIDGSWFRVGLISLISLMALMDAKACGYNHLDLETSIEKAYEWSQKLRTFDGGCREAINLNVWDTALSVISLNFVDDDKYDKQIRKAAKWLKENQNDDGGWPFSGLPAGGLPSDADDTALSVSAMLKSGIDKHDPVIQNGLKWLLRKQSENGSWGTYRPGAGDTSCVSVTCHAIDAFLDAGGFENEVEKALDWLRMEISEDGYWSDLWLAKNTYGTSLAITAFVKAGKGDIEEVERGVRWLHKSQNPDGGWGEDMAGNLKESTVEQTAWSTQALLMVDPKSSTALKGLKYITENQKDDGHWPQACVGIYWEVIGGYSNPVNPMVFALNALKQETLT
ncbi:hypothetical protein GF312_08400 [Candidatus Poribacteria bacterium]|nr:hypothetical protein [Candidatus Poribacteria bacterium]